MKLTNPALLLVMLFGLSGCGYNTQAVKDFNESSVGFTKSYSEIMKKSVKWCYESMLSSELGKTNYVSASAMKKNIDGECEAFAANVKTAEASAVVINTYAAALSALVGVSPQFLADDAKNLKDAALTIKGADGNQVLNKEDAEAFEQLTKLLSEMITTAAIKDKATNLMRDNYAAVNRQVDTMLAVADVASTEVANAASVSNTALVSNIDFVGARKGEKNKNLSNEQALIYRYLAYIMAQQHPDQKEVDDALAKFKAAGEALKKANINLEQKFSTLSKKDQLQSINDFANKVETLRDSIHAMNK
ncbi:hypothetical protein [Pseudomonas carassii]|uniref:Lipoprotein n=1 Tax=Pseudomonas carassii TaxID=3115855 RepID=A0ABU7HB36_9PSED|nr:hypothetical protein [Pseudomonas sp. 137P]MEE1888197.1 hypothetical protein [Pseudomonas sp. 137P]